MRKWKGAQGEAGGEGRRQDEKCFKVIPRGPEAKINLVPASRVLCLAAVSLLPHALIRVWCPFRMEERDEKKKLFLAQKNRYSCMRETECPGRAAPGYASIYWGNGAESRRDVSVDKQYVFVGVATLTRRLELRLF